MSLRAVGRMMIGPAGVTLAVGILLRPLWLAAIPLAADRGAGRC